MALQKKPYFFYFSSYLFCDAENTTTDNIVFRKPTSPPLTLREGPPLISVFFNSLYDPFGSPCRGQKPQGRRGNRPTRCRFFESLRLPFQRELHLFPQAPSSSEGGGCNRSSSELSFRKPTRPSLPLRKAPPLISVFSPQGRRGNRSSSELKPLRYKVGGPSEVCARFLCGMGPPCCFGY